MIIKSLQFLLANFFSKEESHFLLILQNNNELRAGGGFITQLMDLQTGRGKLQFVFRNEYKELRGEKAFAAPPKIEKLLKLKRLFLRDANHEADFKANASRIIEIYSSLFPGVEVSGVAAVNFSFLEKLMQIFGAIKLDGEKWTAGNIFYHLSARVSDIDYHDLKALNGRKLILNRLFKVLLRRTAARFWKWPHLYREILNAIGTKDIQLNFRNEKLQKHFEGKGLIFPFCRGEAKDCLAVIEDNFLGLKSNRYIRRIILHDVELMMDRVEKRLGGAQVKVKCSWDHFGSHDYPLSGTYQSHYSIYIPHEAEKIRLQQNCNFELENEGSFKKISFSTIIPAGGKMVLDLSYELPKEMFADNRYSFKFIKQSGVKNEQVFETVSFPDQFEISGKAGNLTINESKAFISTGAALHDYDYCLEGKLHHRSPRIFFHEMSGPSTINIRFNEPVYFRDDPRLKIKICDAETGKCFNIRSVSFRQDNRHILIDVPDLPQIREKKYIVELSGLHNQVMTPLGDRHRKMTVVYRDHFFEGKR